MKNSFFSENLFSHKLLLINFFIFINTDLLFEP